MKKLLLILLCLPLLSLSQGPTAAFLSASVCLGDSTIFTNLSVLGSAPISQWYWDFGDGMTSTNQNPSYVYDTCDTYNVSLIVIDNNGLSDSVTSSVYVLEIPEASYTVNPDCDGEAIYYINTSPSLSLIDSVLWTLNQTGQFVNGTNAGSQDIAVIFSNPGMKFTELIVRDIYGCFSAPPFELNVEVYANPSIINLTTDTICDNTPTTFEFNAFNGSDPNLTYTWDYGDLQTSDSSNSPHQHEYLNCNTYIVSLTIEDGNTCQDDATTNAIVRCNPVADFLLENDSICVLDTTCFTANVSVSGSAPIYFWNWNFGVTANPQVSYGIVDPCCVFSYPGIGTIILDVLDTNGCYDETIAQILVYDCEDPAGILELIDNQKELLKVTDILGRETKQTNQPLFYIYDDGTVEKRIVIE